MQTGGGPREAADGQYDGLVGGQRRGAGRGPVRLVLVPAADVWETRLERRAGHSTEVVGV